MKYFSADNDIYASIVTYNPDISRLKKNISALLSNGVKRIIIVENGSKNISEIEKMLAGCFQGKPILIRNPENMGIAYALNQSLNTANKQGCRWLLTLDQDSICGKNYFAGMSEYLSRSDIGIIYPKIYDPDVKSERSIKISRLQSFFRGHSKNDNLPMPITSGALTNVSAGINSGGFTDRLFIDCVDHDFNLKLYEHNFKIIESPTAILYHSLGKPKGYRFLGWYFISNGYPAWRYYYITRNAWLLKQSHPSDLYKKWCNKNLRRSLSPLRILHVFIANHFDFHYISYMFKGHYDGICKKIRPHNEIIK
ncbi:MAG: glycosyltransferase [Synergistaceae bacterium]|nr:glycosyltransferase [Synergistaceae bacterium]